MDINKEKCMKLKQIRKKLADTLNIDLHQRECTYEGACSGTCPKCKQEEQQLNQAILAKSAMVAGVAAMAVGLTGCNRNSYVEGDVVYVEPPTEVVEDVEGMEDDGKGNGLPVDTEEPDTTEDVPEGTAAEPEESETAMEIWELTGDVAYPENSMTEK